MYLLPPKQYVCPIKAIRANCTTTFTWNGVIQEYMYIWKGEKQLNFEVNCVLARRFMRRLTL